jgi:hypothetical protein
VIGPVGSPLTAPHARTEPAHRVAHPLDWLIPGRDALGLTLLVAAAVAIGIGVGVLRGGAHVGGVLALVLGALSYTLAVGRVAGAGVALLALLLVAQAGHSVEHVVQLTQIYLLDLPGVASQGFLVVANVEWVHAAWSSGVALGAIALVAFGLRTPWAWLLLLWSLAHAGEHGYLLVRALQVQAAMADLGLPFAPAVQALPGIVGRDGWLATSPFASWCTSVPGLVTAPRPVVHFVWNSGEMLLLVAAASGWRRLLRERRP